MDSDGVHACRLMVLLMVLVLMLDVIGAAVQSAILLQMQWLDVRARGNQLLNTLRSRYLLDYMQVEGWYHTVQYISFFLSFASRFFIHSNNKNK